MHENILKINRLRLYSNSFEREELKYRVFRGNIIIVVLHLGQKILLNCLRNDLEYITSYTANILPIAYPAVV